MKPAVRASQAGPALSSILRQRHTQLAQSASTIVQQRASYSGGRSSLHTTAKGQNAATPTFSPPQSANTPSNFGPKTIPPLSVLSWSSILRSYFITSISSSPTVLTASTNLLRRMLASSNPLFSLKYNPLMRGILWHTFYKQFCAGETQQQITATCNSLQKQGYGGVILEYALEVLKDAEGVEAEDVAFWKGRLLETVKMSQQGDFVGLKWSGMGPAALRRMAAQDEPSELMLDAMESVCRAAQAKNVSLLPAAEETWNLPGFNDWCMRMQRTFNRDGQSVIYTTYQAYLRQTPANLAADMALASREGFTLGIKMVRGAYLGSEKRDLIHPSAEATHACYDGIAAALIHRDYNATLRAADNTASASFPHINVVLATHNAASVASAQSLRQSQLAVNTPLTPLAFAQLQGMADEVSCSLLAAAKAADAAPAKADGSPGGVKERVLKCTTWGSMYECLNYLLRRAAENKDAAGRTAETRKAMGSEILRRVRGFVGLS